MPVSLAVTLRLSLLVAFLSVAGGLCDMAYAYIFDGQGLHPAAAYPAAVGYGLLCWAGSRLIQRATRR